MFAAQVTSLSNACDALRRSGGPGVAVALLERAIALARDRLGPADRLTLLLRHNQAAALALVDAEEAARRFDELIADLTEHFGERDRLTLRARRQREFLRRPPSAAITGQRVLLRTWEELCGVSSPEVAEAL